MTPLFRLAALLAFLLAPWAAVADSGSSLSGGGGGGGGGGGNVTVVGPLGTSTAPALAVSVSCVSGCQAGTVSNTASAQVSTATNIGAVSWNYGYNGTTWDQLQVDSNKSLITVIKQGAAVLSATNGLYTNILQGNAAVSATNGLFTNVVIAGGVQSATNGQYANILQGNAALSATNGIYANILQGNAAISATNGLYFNLLQGNTVVGSGNPIYANITNGIVGTNTGVACGTACMIGVQGNVTATDIPVSVAGTASNAGSAVASSSTNVRTVAFAYGYNGTTWDQLQVDASKFLKVNCATGCNAGTISNATSGVATSSTNAGSVDYLYGFNGTTWDQLQVDASKFLKVNCATGCGGSGTVSNATSAVATSATNTGAVSWLYGFNGTTWDQLQVDASKFLKVNCATGCSSGTVSNATSAVATSSTNNGSVSWNYAFNGTTWDQLRDVSNATSAVPTSAFNLAAVSFNYGWNGATWDQLQVDGSKSLKVILFQGPSPTTSTNGIYTNLLQGNATISPTNGLYTNLLQGNAVLSQTNPAFVQSTGNYFSNVVGSTLTRPADTTTYTAFTTVCLAKTVTACAPMTASIALTNSGKGLITQVTLLKSSATVTNASFTIHFFSAAPGVATPTQFDNTAYSGPRAGDLPTYLGNAVCNQPLVTSDTTPQAWFNCVLSNPNTSGALPFQALSGSTNVNMLLEVTAAYVPVSGETFKVYLSGVY